MDENLLFMTIEEKWPGWRIAAAINPILGCAHSNWSVCGVMARFIMNRIQLNVSPICDRVAYTYFHKILLPAIAILHCVAFGSARDPRQRARWHVD